MSPARAARPLLLLYFAEADSPSPVLRRAPKDRPQQKACSSIDHSAGSGWVSPSRRSKGGGAGNARAGAVQRGGVDRPGPGHGTLTRFSFSFRVLTQGALRERCRTGLGESASANVPRAGCPPAPPPLLRRSGFPQPSPAPRPQRPAPTEGVQLDRPQRRVRVGQPVSAK